MSGPPPVNLEAEGSVLGGMMVAEAAIERVLGDGLRAEHFYHEKHRAIFEAIVALCEKHEPVDSLIVSESLERKGKLAEVGGREYVQTLASTVPSAANAPHYGQIVRDNAELRRELNAYTEGQAAISEGDQERLAKVRESLSSASRGLSTAAVDWLESAGSLLTEPDPGPTPFAVDELLVESSVAAIQGQHKVGKTWVVLELAIALASGRRAFDRYAVPTAGPVILILEESGRAALHRRLGSLRRGTGVEVADLVDLHFAANLRVRLDDAGWRQAIIRAGQRIQPRAIFLDPLVRLKGASVDENAQKEMAPVLDFMRDLRDATGAAVVFVHHTGHDATRLRGTSDLEAYWESKIVVRRDESGVCTLSSEHREAEAGRGLSYRLAWHEDSRSIRLTPTDDPPAEEQRHDELVEYLCENPDSTLAEVAEGVSRRKAGTRSRLLELQRAGTVDRRQSERRDRAGRPRHVKGWFAVQDAGLPAFPPNGNSGEPGQSGTVRVPAFPALIGPERELGPAGTNVIDFTNGRPPEASEADLDTAAELVMQAFPGSVEIEASG